MIKYFVFRFLPLITALMLFMLKAFCVEGPVGNYHAFEIPSHTLNLIHHSDYQPDLAGEAFEKVAEKAVEAAGEAMKSQGKTEQEQQDFGQSAKDLTKTTLDVLSLKGAKNFGKTLTKNVKVTFTNQPLKFGKTSQSHVAIDGLVDKMYGANRNTVGVKVPKAVNRNNPVAANRNVNDYTHMMDLKGTGTDGLPHVFNNRTVSSSSSSSSGGGNGGRQTLGKLETTGGGNPPASSNYNGGGKGNPNAGAPRDRTLDFQRKIAPKVLEGFPQAVKVPSKNYVQGGGAARKRWEDKKFVYEWDSRHGTVEKYNKGNKQHVGEFDPNTGDPLKPADPTRKLKD